MARAFMLWCRVWSTRRIQSLHQRKNSQPQYQLIAWQHNTNSRLKRNLKWIRGQFAMFSNKVTIDPKGIDIKAKAMLHVKAKTTKPQNQTRNAHTWMVALLHFVSGWTKWIGAIRKGNLIAFDQNKAKKQIRTLVIWMSITLQTLSIVFSRFRFI